MGSNPGRKLSLLGFAHPVEGSPFQVQGVSHPDSRTDPKGGSELGLGRETIYWDSLIPFSDIGGPKSYNIIKISYTK